MEANSTGGQDSRRAVQPNGGGGGGGGEVLHLEHSIV